jgi:hypothetical protein
MMSFFFPTLLGCRSIFRELDEAKAARSMNSLSLMSERLQIEKLIDCVKNLIIMRFFMDWPSFTENNSPTILKS